MLNKNLERENIRGSNGLLAHTESRCILKLCFPNPTSILFLPPHPSLLLSIRFLLFSVLLIARSGPLALQSATAAAGLVQPGLYTSKYWINGIRFYSSAFQDFIAGGYLSPESKALCVETPTGRDVFALREIGEAAREVWPRRADSFRGRNLRFRVLRRGLSAKPAEFAAEIGRTLRPGGFAVFHFANPKDTYSFNSFLDLFNCFKVVKLHGLEGFDSSMPYIREIVLKKECGDGAGKFDFDDSNGKCYVPGYKHDLVKIAEPLIEEEPLKP
ncbi:hypothetical protein HKD37_09G026839 [Glycine soja]